MSSIVVKTLMSLTINKNLTSSIIVENSISFNCSTILNCRIFVKIIITLLNFLFKILNINVALLSTTLIREKLDRLTQALELSFLFIRKIQKFKSTS
jgi:hypothetical protein